MTSYRSLQDELELLKRILAERKSSTAKVTPAIRKAPKGPSRSWRNPALLHPPPAVQTAPAPAKAVPTKILVNPNFKQGAKILVNPNFKPPNKILVNPAFSQSIHVNPKLLAPPKSPRVLYKSKNKLILKKQQSVEPVAAKPKSSPLIFKSKNKLVRRTTTTVKKTPVERKNTRPGSVTVISGERFVSNGGTRLTRLQTIQRQAKQRSLSVLANKRKWTSLPCTIFRKLGRCPKGDACERLHVPPAALFKYRKPEESSPNKETAKKVEGGKKKESRYFQTTEEQECKAVRPVRIKVLGELPSFIPL